MKKIKSMLLLACSFLILVSCTNSSDSEDPNDPNDPNPSADLIVGNWKLIGYKEPNGEITSVEPCVKVFYKFEANAALSVTVDDCGDLASLTGTWAKTSVANQYKFTATDGTVEYKKIFFTDNNTRFYTEELNPDRNGGVYQKQ
jgi:hypothetical protein